MHNKPKSYLVYHWSILKKSNKILLIKILIHTQWVLSSGFVTFVTYASIWDVYLIMLTNDITN